MTTKRPTQRVMRAAKIAALLALVVAWALLLRPQVLGGPAAYVIVSGKSMEPALGNGDLVVALEKRSYSVGDVIAYRIPRGDPGAGSLVIHRVTGGSASAGYVTQGDNRQGQDLWKPKPRDVLGSMSLRLPRVGLALAFVETPLGIAIAAALATFLFVSAGSGTTRRRLPRVAAPWGVGSAPAGRHVVATPAAGSHGAGVTGPRSDRGVAPPPPPAPPGRRRLFSRPSRAR